MSRIKVYISGPITGIKNYNQESFDNAAININAAGYEAVNPFDVSVYTPGKSWADYMRADIKALMDCDAVLALPGWSLSKGARIEVDLARALSLRIVTSIQELNERLGLAGSEAGPKGCGYDRSGENVIDIPCPECGAPSPLPHRNGCSVGEAFA